MEKMTENTNIIEEIEEEDSSNFVMDDSFFENLCEIVHDERKLILSGKSIMQKIGRRFEDGDIPDLCNYLRNNSHDFFSLILPYNEIRSSGFINLLHYISKHNHILELNLQNNEIGEEGIRQLHSYADSLAIRTLRLNGNKFGVKSSKLIARMLSQNTHLRYLDIAEVGQTASSLVYFTTVLSSNQTDCNTTLQVIDLSRPSQTFDVEHIADCIGRMLRYNKSLRELYLQKYTFSCHDIETMLINAKFNDTLYLLNLNCNNIGDHGLQCLASWIGKSALQEVCLSRNIITNSGARALSYELSHSRVQLLDLSYNKMNDEGIKHILNTLKKNRNSQNLRLFGNHLGHPTVKILQRMLISGALKQENIDIRPYRVEKRWNAAYYPADCYRQKYYDVPYNANSQSMENNKYEKHEFVKQKLGISDFADNKNVQVKPHKTKKKN